MGAMRKVSWIDMVVPNTDETSQFYCNVFGFEREEEDEGGGNTSYHINDEGSPVLGICAEGAFPGWVKGWLPYLDVEDYDHSVAEVESSGGKIHQEMTFDFNWKGQRFCLAIDPSGAPIMICESKSEESD